MSRASMPFFYFYIPTAICAGLRHAKMFPKTSKAKVAVELGK